jgi:hypothetical protein
MATQLARLRSRAPGEPGEAAERRNAMAKEAPAPFRSCPEGRNAAACGEAGDAAPSHGAVSGFGFPEVPSPGSSLGGAGLAKAVAAADRSPPRPDMSSRRRENGGCLRPRPAGPVSLRFGGGPGLCRSSSSEAFASSPAGSENNMTQIPFNRNMCYHKEYLDDHRFRSRSLIPIIGFFSRWRRRLPGRHCTRGRECA